VLVLFFDEVLLEGALAHQGAVAHGAASDAVLVVKTGVGFDLAEFLGLFDACFYCNVNALFGCVCCL